MQAQQHDKQQKVNAQVAKQLAFLIDNTKKFLKLANPQLTLSTPSLQAGKGKS